MNKKGDYLDHNMIIFLAGILMGIIIVLLTLLFVDFITLICRGV